MQGVIVSFDCGGLILFAIVISLKAYKVKAHRMKRKIISLNKIGSTLCLMAEHHYKKLYIKKTTKENPMFGP